MEGEFPTKTNKGREKGEGGSFVSECVNRGSWLVLRSQERGYLDIQSLFILTTMCAY